MIIKKIIAFTNDCFSFGMNLPGGVSNIISFSFYIIDEDYNSGLEDINQS